MDLSSGEYYDDSIKFTEDLLRMATSLGAGKKKAGSRKRNKAVATPARSRPVVYFPDAYLDKQPGASNTSLRGVIKSVPLTQVPSFVPAARYRSRDFESPKSGESPASMAPPASQPVRKETFTNVYVRNLSQEDTKKELYKLFEPIGKVTSAVVKVDNLGRSFGFVNFANHLDAMKAIEILHGTEHHGKRLHVARAQKEEEREKRLRHTYVVWIHNLDGRMDDALLRETFAVFGNIISCQVTTDEQAPSTRSGNVHYETVEAADAAIKAWDGMFLNKKKIRVGRYAVTEKVCVYAGGHTLWNTGTLRKLDAGIQRGFYRQVRNSKAGVGRGFKQSSKNPNNSGDEAPTTRVDQPSTKSDQPMGSSSRSSARVQGMLAYHFSSNQRSTHACALNIYPNENKAQDETKGWLSGRFTPSAQQDICSSNSLELERHDDTAKVTKALSRFNIRDPSFRQSGPAN